jgi:hypothetical protein
MSSLKNAALDERGVFCYRYIRRSKKVNFSVRLFITLIRRVSQNSRIEIAMKNNFSFVGLMLDKQDG